MTHISSYIKSLKISWIKRLLNTDSAWKHIFYHTLETDQLKIDHMQNSLHKEQLMIFGKKPLLPLVTIKYYYSLKQMTL